MKLKKTLITTLSLLSISSIGLASPFTVCSGTETINASWQMSPTIHERFTSSMVQAENIDLSKEVKIERVLQRVLAKKGNRVHDMPLSDEQLAATIVWAADCTGNDFQVLTAMLELESYICGDRTGPNGDRGCSMFTGAAINTFKNQMRLPGRKDSQASPRSTAAYHEMIRSCYQEYEGSSLAPDATGLADDFVSLFSQSHSAIKSVLLSGSAIHADLLAGAVHLKFNSALAGGYWIPGSAPGGVNRYNGSGHAASYSRRVKNMARNVDLNCTEDLFTPSVRAAMCEMEEDVNTCLQDLENEYNGSVEI